jgi:hypothetical protein
VLTQEGLVLQGATFSGCSRSKSNADLIALFLGGIVEKAHSVSKSVSTNILIGSKLNHEISRYTLYKMSHELTTSILHLFSLNSL